MAKTRPYLFYDTAISVCDVCLSRVEGRIIIMDNHVYMDKRCHEHGSRRVLLADDAEYYRKAREIFIKPPRDAPAI